jgi:hypothetical protein
MLSGGGPNLVEWGILGSCKGKKIMEGGSYEDHGY